MSTTIDSQITESISDRAWEAIRGGYDLQVHVAPDVIERRPGDVDLAKDFLAHGLKGFALYAQRFLDAGFSVEEIHHMAATIPARLVEE